MILVFELLHELKFNSKTTLSTVKDLDKRENRKWLNLDILLNLKSLNPNFYRKKFNFYFFDFIFF